MLRRYCALHFYILFSFSATFSAARYCADWDTYYIVYKYTKFAPLLIRIFVPFSMWCVCVRVSLCLYLNFAIKIFVFRLLCIYVLLAWLEYANRFFFLCAILFRPLFRHFFVYNFLFALERADCLRLSVGLPPQPPMVDDIFARKR